VTYLSSRLITISLLSSCILLQGCQSVKKTFGWERDAPDEFAVNPCMQPLDMPPDFYALPVPQPGAPRPQEVKAMQAKREKILGVKSVEGKASPGQRALLDMAGAEEGQGQVRGKIDEESRIESLNDKPVLEKLGLKKSKPKGDVINPSEEAAKLEEQGLLHTQPTKAQQ